MNIENLDKLIRTLEDESNHLNMARMWYDYERSQPACVGGWCSHLFGPRDKTWRGTSYEAIMIALDVDARIGEAISYGYDSGSSILLSGHKLEELTRAEVLAMLRHLRETDEVRWKPSHA